MAYKRGAAASRGKDGGYDAAKDVIVETLWKHKVNDKTGLRLVVRRYDNGSPKIAVEEVFVRRDGRPGSKGLPRVAARLAALPGFCEAYATAAAKYAAVEPERKSAPAAAPEGAFELFDAE